MSFGNLEDLCDDIFWMMLQIWEKFDYGNHMLKTRDPYYMHVSWQIYAIEI